MQIERDKERERQRKEKKNHNRFMMKDITMDRQIHLPWEFRVRYLGSRHVACHATRDARNYSTRHRDG